MLLQEKETGNLVKVMDFQSLINPNESEIIIQIQAGQEEQDPEPEFELEQPVVGFWLARNITQ